MFLFRNVCLDATSVFAARLGLGVRVFGNRQAHSDFS